jgi:hypothetical protein
MKARKQKSIGQLFAEGRAIDAAMRKAAQEAQRRHREAGQPMVVWRNGKTVLVAPENIPPSKKAGA